MESIKSKIKTYKKVIPNNDSVSFDMKRMEDVYEKSNGKPDEAHRHDYYIILVVKEAKGKHIIDFNEFDLKAQQIHLISPGQVHQIIENKKSLGYVITFSKQFLDHNYIEQSFLNNLYLFQENGYSPPIEINEKTMSEASFFAEKMILEINSESKQKYEALGAWLKLLLILAAESCNLKLQEHTQTIQAGKFLLNDFKELLEENYNKWHKVSKYASMLNVTPDHLNSSIKGLTGKNVKEYIQNRIILAAKRMLLFSNLTTKEIAYELGFSAPANFSQFFKKQSGLSPSAFKKLY